MQTFSECDLSKCQTFYKQQYKPRYDPKILQRANSVQNIGSIKKVTVEQQSRLLCRFLKVNIPPSFSKKKVFNSLAYRHFRLILNWAKML